MFVMSFGRSDLNTAVDFADRLRLSFIRRLRFIWRQQADRVYGLRQPSSYHYNIMQIVVRFKTLKACRGVEDCEPVLHGDAFHLNRLGEYSLLEAFWKYLNNIADFGKCSALA